MKCAKVMPGLEQLNVCCQAEVCAYHKRTGTLHEWRGVINGKRVFIAWREPTHRAA